ncbi:MAG: hypothetical protein JWM11_7581 [Planctomycetaceae bacterium]|nr:hypothetical protein [Planctomycetaceae bacterium]
MAREELKLLYHNLSETRFSFVPRGQHHIRDVYAIVKVHYPELCDDTYLCSENCQSGANSPEWKHKIRAALWGLQRFPEMVRYASQRGYWSFGTLSVSNPIELISNDLEPPTTNRVQTTISRIVRDTALARQVKALHDHACQICGLRIELPDGARYAEAHHIQPLGFPHDGPDVVANIIVLCPNHHAMLDYGVLSLDLSQLRLQPQHAISNSLIDYHNSIIHAATRFAK